MEGFTSPTLAHEMKMQLLKCFLCRPERFYKVCTHCSFPWQFLPITLQFPHTHQEAVTQSMEAVLVCLQFIPVQLPAARGLDDEGQPIEHRLTDPFRLQSPARTQLVLVLSILRTTAQLRNYTGFPINKPEKTLESISVLCPVP